MIVDMNVPEFQQQLVALDKHERHAVISTIGKLLALDWPTLYAHTGLNWEQIKESDAAGPDGTALYSLRATQKMRLVVFRKGDSLVLLSIHPDHDSAYS